MDHVSNPFRNEFSKGQRRGQLTVRRSTAPWSSLRIQRKKNTRKNGAAGERLLRHAVRLGSGASEERSRTRDKEARATLSLSLSLKLKTAYVFYNTHSRGGGSPRTLSAFWCSRSEIEWSSVYSAMNLGFVGFVAYVPESAPWDAFGCGAHSRRVRDPSFDTHQRESLSREGERDALHHPRFESPFASRESNRGMARDARSVFATRAVFPAKKWAPGAFGE